MMEGICLPQSWSDGIASGDGILEDGLESLQSGGALLMAGSDDAREDGLSSGAVVGTIAA